MKRMILAILCAFVVAGFALADLPRTIAFQATLKDSSGKPITSRKSVSFTLYDAATGGNALWTETKDITPNSNGILTTALGDTTAFTSITWDQSYWMGVKVVGDSEMQPRLSLESVPYAQSVSSRYVTIAGRRILLSLAETGGGQLLIANDLNDNRIYLEGCGTDGPGNASEFIICGTSVNTLPKFTVFAALSRLLGDASVGGALSVGGGASVSGPLSVGGGASCSTLTLTSSRRFKRNVQPLTKALDTISQLQGVSYDWDSAHGGKPDIGFIAEDFGQVLPDLVAWEPNGKDAKGLDYTHLTAILAEGIKEQQGEIAALKAENAAKDAQLVEQGRQIADLAARLERLEQKEGKR